MCLRLFALCLVSLPALAVSPRQVTWGELSFVVGHRVRIAMPDGVAIAGTALAVEPQALVVRIEKSSLPSAYPKGEFRVPRAALRAFEMNAKTKRFRIIATALGSGLGLVGGCAAAIGIQGGLFGNQNQGQAAAAVIGIWAGGTAGGYLLGNAADRRNVTVIVKE
jgi:hypothetical protein